MKVEIWSDVMCPFCYIGKRKFENALAQFPHKDDIEVEWKSFQLDPSIVTDPSKTVHEFLSERKGISPQRAKEMNDYVTNIALQVGLEYKFDKAVVANSFDAHRFSHLAKKHGLQNEAEEKLFKAYFTEGKNTADVETLVKIGAEIGLEEDEIRNTLAGDDFSDEVKNDIYMAQQIGINGVPFFVLDNKYAISGAQESTTFLAALNQAWTEHKPVKVLTPHDSEDGAFCSPESC